MAQNEYYPEEVLVGKMQSGNESAAEFVRFKDEQLEAAMERGDA